MEKDVTLITKEKCIVKVKRNVIEKSKLIKVLLSELGHQEQGVPLPNVSLPILTKIIEYCQHYQDVEQNDIQLEEHQRFESPSRNPHVLIKPKGLEPNEFDLEYIRVDQSTLYELIMAANYLDIKPLLDLACYSVAKMFSEKSPQEIRDTFGLSNNLDLNQEAELSKRNCWLEY
ncbi:E3 ubiquitin ligase complex SCF subunit sconC [Smittium mucronatum]|uniref:E3 ubiquitin ligase complex SCF subunit n=1 Tax=Smittium mucronatum TaxID=133383 RepID=A0A1R0GTN7_9FUNG|nr:E3 ubiquitin ligase complex SCF subunit sconC [Smittium mucronatum]